MANFWKRLGGSMALALCAAGAVHAGDIKVDADKDVVWQAGVDGVEIEWGPDGKFNRIYSAFYQPVNFPDRRGINKAQIIAEEKAKAAIVRFIDQQSHSNRLVEQVDKDLEQATQTQGTDKDSFTKQNQRTMIETLTEVTGSFASGRLRGVIVLEKGYDETKAEAWVKVGMSRKTMAAAQGLAEGIGADRKSGNPDANAGTGAMRQPTEVRRSNQKDW